MSGERIPSSSSESSPVTEPCVTQQLSKVIAIIFTIMHSDSHKFYKFHKFHIESTCKTDFTINFIQQFLSGIQ